VLDKKRIVDETFLVRLDHFIEVESTNLTARSQPIDLDMLPRLSVADRQTAGRGQRSARWWSGPGSLMMSLVLGPGQLVFDPNSRSMIPLSIGLALYESIRPLLVGRTDEKDLIDKFGLHWPNDLFLDGRKLAGILVESLADGRTIIGIGVNTNCRCRFAPEGLGPSIVSLVDYIGDPVEHTGLIIAIMKSIWQQLELLRLDPQKIVAQFDPLCLQRDKRLRVGQRDAVREGDYAGIAEDGRLLIRTDSGTRVACHSGPVRVV
jgi:BirA family transcriptional regulator, biotin operon repressor / biotin---[acetyl-CoA-carboxylase] ligase